MSASFAAENLNDAYLSNCNISIDSGDGHLFIHGLDAPIEIVKVFNEHWEIIYECTFNCSNPSTVPNLSTGIYYVRVNKYTANWVPICQSELIPVTIDNSAPPVDYCAELGVIGGEGQITVTGVNAPWQKIQFYGPSTNGALSTICNDNCTDPQVISNLAAGQYVVRIEQSGNNNGAANSCTREAIITVTSPATAIDYCSEVGVVGGEGTINITGINAPWNRVYYRNDTSADYIEICNDCANPLNLSNTSAGTYIIKIEQSDDDGSNFCSVETAVNVTATDFCRDVSVMGGVGTIRITGMYAPWNLVFYKLEGTSEYIEVCNDCASPLSISNLGAGNYTVKVQQSEGDGSNRCSVEMMAVVTGSATNYCAEVGVLGGEGTITVTGINAPWNRVYYKLVGSSNYTEVCNDCASPLSLSNLEAGIYVIKVEQSEVDGSNFCSIEIAANVASSARDYCAEVGVLGGEGAITVTGIDAPWNRVYYKLVGSTDYTEVCNDCASPLSLSSLEAGTYVIKVEQSEVDGSNSCSIEIAANVTSAVIDYCADIRVYGEEGQIRITGVNAPWQRIQYTGPNTNGVYVTACNDNCGNPEIIPNLWAGTYIVSIEQSGNNNGAANSCTFDVIAIVTEADEEPDYCADVAVVGGAGEITVTGVTAPWNRIEYRAENGTYIEVCNDDCTNPQSIADLPAGNYIVRITQSDAREAYYCTVAIAAVVTNANGNSNGNGAVEICADRSATNTTSCDFGTYGAYLNTFNENIGVFYDIIESSFVEYTDGTARFTGTLVNKVDVWIRFDIDVVLTGRTTTAGQASPKAHTCGRPQDLSTFYYYPSFSGTITGAENAEGALITLQNNGPAFQVGNGANITENRFPQPFGASGWFQLTVVNQPNDFTLNFPENPAAQVGDFNITLSGAAPACLDASSRSAEFTTFNAYANKRQVDLEWVTNTSYKSDYYVLEKSTNGADFNALEKVGSTPKVLETAYFKGLDEKPILGDNFYRLKQVFQDGSIAYSRVRKVHFGVDLDAIATFPNPAQDVLYMDLSEYAGKKANILISNQFGGVVAAINLEQLPSDLVEIDLSKFTNGLYLIRTKIDRTRIISQKMVVSKMY